MKASEHACRVCANRVGNLSYQLREMMFGFREVFTYTECGKCGCVAIDDIPEDMDKYYPDNYYSKQAVPSPGYHRNQKYANALRRADSMAIQLGYPISKIAWWKHAPSVQMECLAHIRPTKNWRILDVGCGAGNFLYRLRNAGFRNLLGVDPFLEESITYQNGLCIRKAELSDISGYWDLITFHHSFEHIADPLDTLCTVSDLLKPNGICVIRIPTVDSYAWRHYRENWVQLDAPRHFILHSVESMRYLSEQSGLGMIGVLYDSSEFQFWASEQYVRDIPLRSPESYAENRSESVLTKQEIEHYRKQAGKLNRMRLGDQAAFFFEKDDTTGFTSYSSIRKIALRLSLLVMSGRVDRLHRRRPRA